MKYDVIVVGGGLGGLTAGAKLAKEGKRVILFEQHDRPGGCATNFRRKDFLMEVGLHEMDGPGERDMKTRVFGDLGVFDKVEFLKVPEFYRFVNRNYEFTMPHDPILAEQELARFFPAEKDGVHRYFDRVMNARKYAKESAGLPESSIGDFLDSIIGNEDLKLILLGNLGYFSDNPYSLSLNYYCNAQGSYFSGGGSFIKGGSQQLSNYLSEFISNNGGTVMLNTLVRDIRFEDGKARAVKYTEKTDPGTILEAEGDAIVWNASVPGLMKTSLPGDYRKSFEKELGSRQTAASLLTVYYGFNKSLKDIGSRYYSYFLYDHSVRSQKDIAANNRSGFESRSFTFVDYGQLDSQLAPEGKSVGAVCCIDYLPDWEGLSREEYRHRKEEAASAFTGKLDALIPGFREAVEYYEVGTARTVERYTLNPGGAVYGFAQTPERVRMEDIIPPPGIHFASAWTKIGGGFSGAVLNGYMCAVKVLRG